MTNELKISLDEALASSYSYDDYKLLVNTLLSKGKSTGNIQNENYFNYSMLSTRRMKRWDKVFRLTTTQLSFFQSVQKSVTFLVISEGWCGDAAHALPILNKIVESCDKLSLNIILRDENEFIMSHFLTNGSKSIPKLIALDGSNNVLFTWGPRPSVATEMVNDFKAKNGTITNEFKELLQKWYNKDKGNTTVNDMMQLLEGV